MSIKFLKLEVCWDLGVFLQSEYSFCRNTLKSQIDGGVEIVGELELSKEPIKQGVGTNGVGGKLLQLSTAMDMYTK